MKSLHDLVVIVFSVTATVVALPTPATMGRLLLLLNSVADLSTTSSSKKARKMSNFNVGSLVQAEVDAHGCLMFLYMLLHIVTRSSLKFFCNTLTFSLSILVYHLSDYWNQAS